MNAKSPKNNSQQKKKKLQLDEKYFQEQQSSHSQDLQNLQQQHKSQAGINFLQQYAQSNHYLSANPSQISYDHFNSPSNRNTGILAHRNSNASISQNSCQQQQTSLNSSCVNRKQKQSPNIGKANKLFPEDFFINNVAIGSPTSSQNLQLSTKNERIREKLSHQQEQNHDLDIHNQNMMNNNIKEQQQYVLKPKNQNYQEVEVIHNKQPKRFTFLQEDQKKSEKGTSEIINQKYLTKNNDQQNEQQLLKHQKFKSPNQRKLLIELSQNQENQNVRNNPNDNEPFDGLKTQYVQLSLDSEKIAKIQGIVKQIKKNQPLNKISQQNSSLMGRNISGSPQMSKKSNKINNKELLTPKMNNSKENSYHDQHSNVNSQNQSERSRGVVLPDLKSSINRNIQNSQDHCIEDDIGQIPNLNETSMLSISNSRQKHNQRKPVYMRSSFKREDHETQNWQTVQVNKDINHEVQNNQINLDNSNVQSQNVSQIRKIDDSILYNAGSPQTYRFIDQSQSNLYSNSKHSNNTSTTLMQPNQNHHYWNRSPQIKRELESQQQLNSHAMYFPQSTRNLQACGGSPQNANSIINKINDKSVKFPNIFNHNANQALQPQTLSYLNYQGSPQTYDNNNISARLISNSNNKLNLSKKGKIALDHNYQVVKNLQYDSNSLSRNNVIHERKETSESERSVQEALYNSEKRKPKQQSIKKIKLDRKMLTSRDQEERWLEQLPERKVIGRVQSKSKLEKTNKQGLLLQEVNEDYQSQKETYQIPFSQSGMCWYNSPRNNANQDGLTTFGPSPDTREQRKQRRKEDKPRYSLPNNQCESIDYNDKQPKTLQRKNSKIFNFNNTKMSIKDLETPNFKHQQSLVFKNSQTFKQRESLQEQTNGNQQNTTKYNLGSILDGQISRNALTTMTQESMPFEFNPNNHDIFNEENLICSSIILDEYSSLPVSKNQEDMRDFQRDSDQYIQRKSSHANYNKCEKVSLQTQNQQVQLVSQKGNVEVRGRSVDGQVEGEIKKFKVITKSKKREQEIVIENKAKLIKQLEKNLKKSKHSAVEPPQTSNTILMEQQEQTQTIQKENIQSQTNTNLQIKESNSSNITSNNNSQLQKKVPVIRKSQIQNQPKSTENNQKVNIVKNTKKTNYLPQMQGQEEEIQKQNQYHNNLNEYNNLKNQNYNNGNWQNQDHAYKNNHNQETLRQAQSNPDYYKTSHFLDCSQHIVPQQAKGQRIPLQSLENKSNQDNFINDNRQLKQQFQQEQTPYFQQKQQVTQHINQIYMAAQIPQEFNGMITFMNIQQQCSDHQSQTQDNTIDNDPFKQTSGSLMRGTILSVTQGNQGFNSLSNTNKFGNNMNIGSQGSCNNSIIMLQSEGNYLTSDFGGQLLSNSPMSTQHLVIMQQQINVDNQQNQKSNMLQQFTNTQYINNNTTYQFNVTNKEDLQRLRSNSNANKENQQFYDNQQQQFQQKQEALNFKVQQHNKFQNQSNSKRAAQFVNNNNNVNQKQSSVVKMKQNQ